MAHTYVSELMHCVFSTKSRADLIEDKFRTHLWAYMGGIARTNGMTALAVGGTANHAHILLAVPSTMPIAKAVQLIKGGSSKWVREKWAPRFAWQDGYGAFSVSVSQVQATIEYIRGQEDHHRKRDFQQEFVAFLKRHGIQYDERYVWG